MIYEFVSSMLCFSAKQGRLLAYAALIISFGCVTSTNVVVAAAPPNPPTVTIELPQRICPGDEIWLYSKPVGRFGNMNGV